MCWGLQGGREGGWRSQVVGMGGQGGGGKGGGEAREAAAGAGRVGRRGVCFGGNCVFGNWATDLMLLEVCSEWEVTTAVHVDLTVNVAWEKRGHRFFLRVDLRRQTTPHKPTGLE